MRHTIRGMLESRKVKNAIKALAALAVGTSVNDMLREMPVSAQHTGRVFPSPQAKQYVPSAVNDVLQHMSDAASACHPVDECGHGLQRDAVEAVQWVSAFGRGAQCRGAISREYERRLRVVRRESRRLKHVSDSIRELGPPHIRDVPRPLHVALIHAAWSAAGAPDVECALDLACGMRCVGDVPPSGWWPPQETPAELCIEDLDHDSWHDRIERQVTAEAEGADAEAAEELRVVAKKTADEVERALMRGPFTRAEMDAAYGRGRWRAMRRFGVHQKGKVRPCDNAKTSLHNACTSRHEKLVCETADFPARVAMAFADEFGEPVPMHSGTDDMQDAYRHVPTHDPRYTVVLLYVPGVGPRYYTMAGFNFGLCAAVPQFNRLSEGAVAVARRLLMIVCCKFFDDFNVTQPSWCAGAAQDTLRGLMVELGCPFSEEKAVDAKESGLIFLGVENDFSGLADEGVVRMRVNPERVARLVELCDRVVGQRSLPTALASSICGKLQFTTSWSFSRVGRAALQPLFAASSRGGHNSELASAPISVANCNAPGFAWRPSDVDIRRPSPLGNPFRMGGGDGGSDSRRAVCEAFGRMLDTAETPQQVASACGLRRTPQSTLGGSRSLWSEIRGLRERAERGERFRLVCTCAPRQCHGHELLRAIGAEQPLDEEALSPGAEASLRFFSSLLPELPPHEFRVARDDSPPPLVWSDARWEEGDPRPAGVGFVVAFPNPGVTSAQVAATVAEAAAANDPFPGIAALREHFELVHGSADVPESFMRGFVRRRQQIGQLEILAALVVYLSLPGRFRRARRAMHWIDNTSAAAALSKGYSGVPDSARLVHAFHAHAAGLGCACYFEYVRSEANVSDRPSRTDLSTVWWDCGLGVEAGLISEPVDVVLPEERDWAAAAGEWSLRARRAA